MRVFGLVSLILGMCSTLFRTGLFFVLELFLCSSTSKREFLSVLSMPTLNLKTSHLLTSLKALRAIIVLYKKLVMLGVHCIGQMRCATCLPISPELQYRA